MFMGMFVALTVTLLVKLGNWNEEDEGHCYITTFIEVPDAVHPRSDIVYIVITAAWNLLALVSSVLGGPKRMKAVVILAAAQFPLHLYMMLALRVKNSNHLDGEESEDSWKFGQTIAVLLLAMVLGDCYHGVIHYRHYEKVALAEGKRNTVDFERLAEIEREALE
jgi:heme/copper-type cytochrome/quinol oxidase subunit 4